MTGIVKKMGG